MKGIVLACGARVLLYIIPINKVYSSSLTMIYDKPLIIIGFYFNC
jgi:dTDP-glucose pyrophosphorylase